eukprot:TRINITY_DN4890_c0_g1_i1.p1 TRINITY_DN4890_c0_g1~~TRINITY_DN4890_c0_g1_i1.p1  ORF type:complete len:431 (-),score=90.73 TRINITY_DN4890_c0_g1_i1:132-1424(-)
MAMLLWAVGSLALARALQLHGSSQESPASVPAAAAASSDGPRARELLGVGEGPSEADALDTEPWRHVSALSEDRSGRNLCGGGRQLPDLYVLGVQKCGTSALARALGSAGVRNVHEPSNKKELHFFNMPIKVDYSLEWQRDSGEDYRTYKSKLLPMIKWDGADLEENRKLWYDYNLPGCPTSKTRAVLADFTPDYVRVVPKPAELGELGGKWRPVDEMNVSIPKFMRRMYGEEASQKLNFVIMLRDPLAQVQSSWYMANRSGFIYCRSCKGPSFQESLTTHLNMMQISKKAQLSAWLWTAMYARQIEHWLEHFDASQFYVAPMQVLSGSDTSNVCRDLSKRLDFPMECRAGELNRVWVGEHPPLDTDAPASGKLRNAFDAVMGAETDRLVKLLAKAHRNGMGLAGYDGPGKEASKAEQVESVRRWLLASW